MGTQRFVNENGNVFSKLINILFIITIFFGLGYWCGKKNYTYQTAIDFLSSEKQKVKNIKKPKLEKKLTEKFTFHKSLKDNDKMLLPSKKLKENKKESKKEKKPVLKPFTLQLASFKKERLAKDYIKKLNAIGLRPYIKKFNLKKQGVWHRIFFGEFESKEAAIEYANQNLKSLSIYFLVVER
ncbi:MAG: SPOR domain-containing protein [bacterium]